jgi:hypothetical protein
MVVTDELIDDALTSSMELLNFFAKPGNEITFSGITREDRLLGLRSMVELMQVMPTMGGLGGLAIFEFAYEVVRTVDGAEGDDAAGEMPVTYH